MEYINGNIYIFVYVCTVFAQHSEKIIIYKYPYPVMGFIRLYGIYACNYYIIIIVNNIILLIDVPYTVISYVQYYNK